MTQSTPSTQPIRYIDDLLYILNQKNHKDTSNEEKKQNIPDETLPLILELFRSKSLQDDTILLQSRHNVFQPLTTFDCSDDIVNHRIIQPLKDIQPNISDGVVLSNTSQTETYKVRCCRVEDAEYIFKLLHETWPDENDSRNSKYWSQNFLQNNEIYGFVIEQIICKTAETNFKNATKNIVGIALYQWNNPDWFNWRETDFPSHVQSEFTDPQYKSEIMKEKRQHKHKVQNNLNLNKNFAKLRTHFIHFTDIAVDPNHRGKGLGTQLMQALIYSFPPQTKYGLEVEYTNTGAIRVYEKCGFKRIRTVYDYYDDYRHAYKMTLVSEYNQSDIELFFETCVAKQAQIRGKEYKDSIQNLSKPMEIDQESNDKEYNVITPPPSLVDRYNSDSDDMGTKSDALGDECSIGGSIDGNECVELSIESDRAVED